MKEVGREKQGEQEARTLEYVNPGNPPQLEVTLLCGGGGGGGGGVPTANCTKRRLPARFPLSHQLRR